MRTLFFAALLFAFASLAGQQARADGLVLQLTDTINCSPVGMVTGYQLNVKTQTFQRGVALGLGYGCRWTGWKVNLGAELVGGTAINDNAPNAGQGSLIFTIADNYGVGPGVQVFRDPVSGNLTGQMLVSFFLTGSWASTVDQLARVKAAARAEGARAAQPAPSFPAGQVKATESQP